MLLLLLLTFSSSLHSSLFSLITSLHQSLCRRAADEPTRTTNATHLADPNDMLSSSPPDSLSLGQSMCDLGATLALRSEWLRDRVE